MTDPTLCPTCRAVLPEGTTICDVCKPAEAAAERRISLGDMGFALGAVTAAAIVGMMVNEPRVGLLVGAALLMAGLGIRWLIRAINR